MVIAPRCGGVVSRRLEDTFVGGPWLQSVEIGLKGNWGLITEEQVQPVAVPGTPPPRPTHTPHLLRPAFALWSLYSASMAAAFVRPSAGVGLCSRAMMHRYITCACASPPFPTVACFIMTQLSLIRGGTCCAV